MPPLLTVTYRSGIYLPEADLWLDPHFPVARAFISHAHADHVARHQMTICSELTLHLMKERYGLNKDATFHALPMRDVHEMGEWEMRLLPAGHILGSAMLHLTRKSDGATLLYTGDYKLRQGLSSEKCELLPADTLIMETTFGLPQFRFPPTAEVIVQMLKFVRETLEDGGIPVLLGYSLGKAQEILCALNDAGYPVMLHKAVWDMTEAVKDILGKVPEYQLFDAAHAKGHVLLFPPSNGKSLALKKLKVCRTAMMTGWALQPGARYRYQVDEIFPLSDHADYPELIETVEAVKPKRVYLVHGYTQEFAADLRALGYEAWTLEKADQMELLLGEPRASAPTDLTTLSLVADSELAGFSQWAAACAKTAEESSRLKKIEVLSTYLRGLEEADLLRATRYCSGMTSDPAVGEAPLNTGWSLIRRALQTVSGVTDVEYRAISRSQADAGRTAYLVLQRAALKPQAVSLGEIAQVFDGLRHASSQVVRVDLLRETLLKLSAHDGSWLVRLMTSELRMGSKEGLIEEAVAAAFEQKPDAVREAAMLCGDIGRAATLAKAGSLAEAKPRAFVPIKMMLASPEETATAIWERMNEGGATFQVASESEGQAGSLHHLQVTDLPPFVWIEDKYDGIRAQVHKVGERVEIFSRDLKPLGGQFPEVLKAVQAVKADVILDGEIIAYAEGKKLTFFDLQKRLGRKDQGDLFLASDITVMYVVFDLLWSNGESLLENSLAERREALEMLLMPEGMALIKVERGRGPEEIEALFMAARRRGNEGLIVKDPASTYSPGRRGKAWLKLKKAFATLDVVVVKAEQGHGKRSHVLSDYTFAVQDETGALRVIGKAYSGLTDAEIEELTEHFTANTLEENGRVRTVVPDTVLEIAFDSIQVSSRHDSGLAMRFPRIKAIRRDKTPGEIDTLAYARKLAGV
ncbi:MAG: ATP-dependent DNA ligase [Verrucomicrobiota bacterium]